MMLRKNQQVAYINEGGQVWKIIKKHAVNKVFHDCQRYDIQNQQGEVRTGVRDKDLLTKTNELYDDFVNNWSV